MNIYLGTAAKVALGLYGLRIIGVHTNLGLPAPVRLSSESRSAWRSVLEGDPAPLLTLCRPELDLP